MSTRVKHPAQIMDPGALKAKAKKAAMPRKANATR
jgi:hypothetical protein